MEKNIKIKPVRVQIELSKNRSGAQTFYQIFKTMYPELNVTKNKLMTKCHLDINVRWFNNTVKTMGNYNVDITIESAIYNKIIQVLSINAFKFFASNIRIGKPMKCSMCNGTGKSAFPKDMFNKLLVNITHKN